MMDTLRPLGVAHVYSSIALKRFSSSDAGLPNTMEAGIILGISSVFESWVRIGRGRLADRCTAGSSSQRHAVVPAGRLDVTSQAQAPCRKIRVGLGIFRGARRRASASLQRRLVRESLVEQGNAEVVVRLGVTGVQLDRNG